MTATSPESDGDPRRIDLTRPQEWVLHHAMVTRCERARADRRTPPGWTLDVIEAVEDGVTSFTPFEARRLQADLEEYARDPETSPGDVRAARAVVAKLERTFDLRLADAPE